jgi:peptidoglycan hydrolase-like protein with peptidoglycan-binding domain
MKIAINKFLITCSALVILVGLVAGCSPSVQATTSPLPPATAPVTRTTLVETRTVPGTLDYGQLIQIRAAGSGTLTWIAPVGSTVMRGETLFRVDEQPVSALYGSVPMYRTLRVGMEGADVQQLQENLAELGYSGFDVDGIYTWATAEAVRAWQADLGLPETGTVKPGELVFMPGAIRIAEHSTRTGDAIGNSPVLSYTDTDRFVTVPLRVADIRLAVEGNTVPVRIPGGGIVEGEVAQVGLVVRESTIDVTITITDQEALGALEVAPVEVDFVSQTRANVLTVPVAALLALSEGGYGVEVVEGNTTRIVAVTTGMFAAGRVEVSGEGIAEGVVVGVAR